jgi:hypothetical protein
MTRRQERRERNQRSEETHEDQYIRDRSSQRSYSFVILSRFYEPNARVWGAITNKWNPIMDIFFLLLERLFKISYDWNMEQSESDVETVPSWLQPSSDCEDSTDDSNYDNIRPTISITSYVSTHDLNQRAYLWTINLSTPYQAHFRSAMLDVSTYINEVLLENRKNMQNRQDIVGSKRNYRPSTSTFNLLDLITPLYEYQKLATPDLQIDAVIEKFGTNWDVSNIQDLLSISMNILTQCQYTAEKNVNGELIPPIVVNAFNSDVFKTTIFPHINKFETFVINQLFEVEWKDPQVVGPLFVEISEETTQKISVPKEMCSARHNADWIRYVRSFFYSPLQNSCPIK